VAGRAKTGFNIPIAQALAARGGGSVRGGLGGRKIALTVLEAFGIETRVAVRP
jgi:hypothetical protein